MKRICNQCQTEMIDDCSVKAEGGLYGILLTTNKIKKSKVNKGFKWTI